MSATAEGIAKRVIPNNGNTRPKDALINEQRAKGNLLVSEAVAYITGRPATTQGTNKLNKLRYNKKVASTNIEGNWFYAKHDLDYIKELFDVQQAPVTPLPSLYQDRYHIEVARTQEPAPPLVVEEEEEDVPSPREETLDPVATNTRAYMLALQTFYQLGIEDFGPVRQDKGDMTQALVWHFTAQETKGSAWRSARILLEGGAYSIICPELLEHMEHQIKNLQQEVRMAQQIAHVYRGKVEHLSLSGWADATMRVKADMRPLDESHVELTCPDYPKLPFVTVGPNREKAEANLRINLCGYLCHLHKKHKQNLLFGHEENYFDDLCLLFGEEE